MIQCTSQDSSRWPLVCRVILCKYLESEQELTDACTKEFDNNYHLNSILIHQVVGKQREMISSDLYLFYNPTEPIFERLFFY